MNALNNGIRFEQATKGVKSKFEGELENAG
jgi:hypothetical protein